MHNARTSASAFPESSQSMFAVSPGTLSFGSSNVAASCPRHGALVYAMTAFEGSSTSGDINTAAVLSQAWETDSLIHRDNTGGVVSVDFNLPQESVWQTMIGHFRGFFSGRHWSFCLSLRMMSLIKPSFKSLFSG